MISSAFKFERSPVLGLRGSEAIPWNFLRLGINITVIFLHQSDNSVFLFGSIITSANLVKDPTIGTTNVHRTLVSELTSHSTSLIPERMRILPSCEASIIFEFGLQCDVLLCNIHNGELFRFCKCISYLI